MSETRRGPKALDREPTPLAGVPRPPAYLSEVARKCWVETTALMAEAGVVSLLDIKALELFCQLYDRYRSALDKCAGDKAVITAPNGYLQKNPWYEIATACQKDLKHYLDKFGLTPAARSKLKVESSEDTNDKFAEFEA